MKRYLDLDEAVTHSITLLHEYGVEVDPGHWQGVSTEGHPDLTTVELMGLAFVAPTLPFPPGAVDDVVDHWRQLIQPNLPWADDHFEERVSGVPSNPGEQYRNWPWWRNQDDKTLTAGRGPTDPKFTHTYQERYWPKKANLDSLDHEPPRRGIRYKYGDLNDLVSLLLREPYTRQAYLPIFFPEDTGAVHGGRIPCTLGYHFLLRNNKLHCWYFIRSCDAVRHFRDDIYLTCRLLLWVIRQCSFFSDGEANVWEEVRPGNLTFVCPSFHVNRGDLHLLTG